MNKIIYFSTAQDLSRYPQYLSKWSYPPNLSNQNFHNKLIRALSITHEIEVISVRPINNFFHENKLPYETFKEENIIWKYIKVTKSKIDKYLNLNRRINKCLNVKIDKNTCVFVDVLNLSLLQNAYKIAKKYGLKIYGICTDNPINISFVNKKYISEIMKIAISLDGYISLTNKINELFNINNKPYVIIDGINEITDEKINKLEYPYIYFGGSLMYEYGVLNLIDAYNKLNRDDIKLVIAGHHEPKDFKDKINENKNIIYLGAIDYKNAIALEKGAICAVNPRPINQKIDDYSIPSKTLEYLASGVISVTVENKLLKEKYDKAILWAKSGNVDDLYDALLKAINLSEKEKKMYLNFQKELIEKYTSFNAVNELIDNSLF